MQGFPLAGEHPLNGAPQARQGADCPLSWIAKALDVSIELYDEVYAAHDLKYHLAYVGGLESIFTPTFRLMLDNREMLFSEGDARVASLFLWHFCEEIEHRSSGVMIYDHVYGEYFYRVSRFKEFMQHVGKVIEAITMYSARSFPNCPPRRSQATQNTRCRESASAFGDRDHAGPVAWHNPVRQALPKYFDEWVGRYERGEDMTRTYGSVRPPIWPPQPHSDKDHKNARNPHQGRSCRGRRWSSSPPRRCALQGRGYH